MRKVTCTLVISGHALSFVQNKELEADDYAVVIPTMLHTHNGFVRGVALDSRGKRSKFAMPVADFDALRLAEVPTVERPTGVYSAV